MQEDSSNDAMGQNEHGEDDEMRTTDDLNSRRGSVSDAPRDDTPVRGARRTDSVDSDESSNEDDDERDQHTDAIVSESSQDATQVVGNSSPRITASGIGFVDL